MHSNHRAIPAVAGLVTLALLMRGAGAMQAPAAATDSYEYIYKENVFDPKRSPWVVSAPAPSVPPPSATDIQLYGVVNVGSVKRAVFKLSPLLAGPGKRQFITLSEGQSVGSYQVAEIRPDQVILAAGEARYPMRFASKPDRSPAGVPVSAPTQAAMELPAAMPTIVPGISVAPQPVIAAPAPAAATTQPAAGAAQEAAAGQAGAKAADSTPAQPAAAPIQGATLLEAIEAARRAQQPSYPNPFAARP